ncbi:MAG TPA: hypothetical protein VLT36_13315 [Candidatus Dormibacteraeota bacterium]|nr:hypothetical protein [Candidatus Dormibacteraeota bacterium]
MGCSIGATSVAADLSRVASQLRRKDPLCRRRFGEYCLRVADTLDFLHVTLRRRERPDLLLAVLQTHAFRLPDVCAGVGLEDLDCRQLANDLVSRSPAGDLGQIANDQELREEFAKLYAEASERFELLADEIDLIRE